jgi:hypothetical protein
MTNPNLTQLLLIVDRSGSMASCQADMIGAIDALFEEQAKLDGDCVVDYVQFDDTYELSFRDKPVSEAKAVLQPRGLTALLDGIGKGVTQLGEKLAARDEAERPGLVMVAVVTDGGENASQDWTREAVVDLVKQQTDEYGWDFVFLGANMDAVSVGTSFGFKADKTMTYTINNTGQTVSALNTYASNVRSGAVSAASASFSDEDRKNAVKK